ncbi:MAG TPA: rhamnogalacturonan acetylesterase [Hyphomonadaceae bacterium]|nr:rhamnogalacturonan acetylesterase [Hyphomonadaceae bacterium]
MRQAVVLALLAGACMTAPVEKPLMQVVMIGDSTAAPYGPERYPQLGWAQVLPCALDANVTVVDDAKGGRSTKSFQVEGWWEKARDKLKPGDVLLIQFGHNDAAVDRPERFIEARPGFKNNLELFVSTARERGATPVLITPVTRRYWENGRITDMHGEYDDVVREVAAATKTPLVDLDADSKAMLLRIGEKPSEDLYLHLSKGYSEYWKDGADDNTHFSEKGARAVAQLVAARLAKLNTPLKGRVDAGVAALKPSFHAGGPACTGAS